MVNAAPVQTPVLSGTRPVSRGRHVWKPAPVGTCTPRWPCSDPRSARTRRRAALTLQLSQVTCPSEPSPRLNPLTSCASGACPGLSREAPPTPAPQRDTERLRKPVLRLLEERLAMTRPSAPRPGGRTRWTALLLPLAWALTSAVSKEVLLHAPREVNATCGQNLTLTCNTSAEVHDIKVFTWSAKGKVGDMGQTSTNSGLQTLSMTIDDIKTSDSGEYLCKLHTRFDTMSRLVPLRVTDCGVKKTSSMNATFAVCRFKDVKTRPRVRWFLDGTDVTDSASEDLTRHASGFFDVTSTIMLTAQARRHRCALWSVPEGRFLQGQAMTPGAAPALTAPGSWLLASLAALKLSA